MNAGFQDKDGTLSQTEFECWAKSTTHGHPRLEIWWRYRREKHEVAQRLVRVDSRGVRWVNAASASTPVWHDYLSWLICC